MTIKTFFITGAEGVGKSSLLKILQSKFPDMDAHDFDEVGVPENPPLSWRLNTTNHWIKIAIKNQKRRKSTCIIGLCFPDEILNSQQINELNCIKFCLLDIKEKEREKRLIKRGASREVIEDLGNLIELRKQIKKVKGDIIDTTLLSIEQAGKKVINWITYNLDV
jgi:hypothetical protein